MNRPDYCEDVSHMNAAEICCDRHAHDETRVGFRHRNPAGEKARLVPSRTETVSSRFAQVLAYMGGIGALAKAPAR